MKKKRIKFGLAILGALAAFLLALLELVLAPTLASAGKGIDTGHGQDGGGQSGYHNPVYFAPPSDNGSGNNGPHHSDNGAGPSCAGASCETHDDGAPGDGPGHGQDDGHGNDQGNNQGNGHSPNHDSEGNSQGGSPGQFAGGGGGGGGGSGGGGNGPHGKSKSCSGEKDKDVKSDDKACDDDSSNNGDNVQQFSSLNDKDGDPSGDSTDQPSDDTNPPNNLRNDDPPGDDDLPPVDPNCFPFTEGCDTHDGNPPDTVLTEEPNKVPEPLTLSLFAVGLTGTAALRRRQKAIARPN